MELIVKKESYIKITLSVFILFFLCIEAYSYQLSMAKICEKIVNGQPRYSSVVFSYSIKKIYCYTLFDQIERETFIYHQWYFKDKLVAKIKLKLKPPVWATFSRIYIRETDIGPWRVEIVDEKGNLIYTLRFSVVK